MKKWIRINSKRNKGEVIQGKNYEQILFDTFDSKKIELERAGFSVLKNGDVYGFTKDADTKEWLISKGFKFDSSEIEKAFDDFAGQKISSLDAKEYTEWALDLIGLHVDTIDFTSLIGSGKNGKVTKKDVEDYIQNYNG